MQTSILAVIFAAASAVVADSCNRGGVYCGSSLLRKGKKDFLDSYLPRTRLTRFPSR